MRVDIQSLGTFNSLAHEGAQAATGALARMTGIDATVDVTKITLVNREDVGEGLEGQSFAGVRFGFEGTLEGDAVLVFESDSAAKIADVLVPGAAGGMARSSITEVGNIMMSGFIDGWADYLGATIDHSPPEYIERTGSAVVPETPADREYDQAFVFTSEIEWVGESVSFHIYMLPEYDPLADRMVEHGGDGDAIPIDKLGTFNEMTTRGTETAAENVEAMTGIATEAEVTQISFAAIEDVPKQIGTDTYVGTVVEFTGVPSGYLVVLFDEPSAVTVAEALMPTGGEGEESTGPDEGSGEPIGPDEGSGGLTDADESAIQELGNIMTSGFVDGWANVLQTPVDHTPPRLVHDIGRAIVDPLAAQVGQHQEHAFVIDSELRTDGMAVRCEIHVLPNERELRQALEDLEVGRAEETDADVERIFE